MAEENMEADQLDEQARLENQWSPLVRRKLRQELRDELVDTNRHRNDITIPDELNRKIARSDKLYKQIVSSREAVIDSEQFKVISEIACHQSQASRGELFHFDIVKYREKLITKMGGRLNDCTLSQLNWDELGGQAIKAFKIAPCLDFSYGALDTVPLRQHIVRRAATSRSTRAPVQAPKQVKDLDDEEESTTKDVKHILHHLKTVCRSHGGMEYHRFIVDPKSFSRTVENIFHYSFLIKEGRAGIRRGEDGNPYVFIPDNVDEAGQSKKTGNCQGIVSVNLYKWQDWIEQYNIKESYIPLRE